MTTITFYRNENNEIIGFEANGHAGYSRSGKDIVCAAISVLLTTLINSVDELTESKYSFEQDETTGYMKFLVEDYESNDIQLLFRSSELGLLGVQEEYSKYLKLTNRRYKP